MTRVSAPTRLHFGLLGVPTGDAPGRRQFGGCGLMLDAPRVVVRAEPSNEWASSGVHAARALEFARRAAPLGRRFAVTVEDAPPEHVGLGVGTQLGMAVARAVTLEAGEGELPIAELARRVGRGERSGIGVHGFASGGFLADGGKAPGDLLAPPLFRAAFPAEWRIVIARPNGGGDWHGARERRAFARPRPSDRLDRVTDRLCRLLLLGMMPSLLERDAAPYGAALTEYNRLSGELFADDQGGDYASPQVARLVAQSLELGALGAAQSSWGPTVFALVADADEAERLAEGLRRDGGELEECRVCGASGLGARVIAPPDEPPGLSRWA